MLNIQPDFYSIEKYNSEFLNNNYQNQINNTSEQLLSYNQQNYVKLESSPLFKPKISSETTLNFNETTPFQYYSNLDTEESSEKALQSNQAGIKKIPTNKRIQKTQGKHFQISEDQIILKFISQSGKNWKEIAEQLPGRSAQNIRNRYYSALRKQQCGYLTTKENTRFRNLNDSSIGENNYYDNAHKQIFSDSDLQNDFQDFCGNSPRQQYQFNWDSIRNFENPIDFKASRFGDVKMEFENNLEAQNNNYLYQEGYSSLSLDSYAEAMNQKSQNIKINQEIILQDQDYYDQWKRIEDLKGDFQKDSDEENNGENQKIQAKIGNLHSRLNQIQNLLETCKNQIINQLMVKSDQQVSSQ